MRRLGIAAALLAMVVGVLAQELETDGRTEAQVKQEHREWMQQVMQAISAIKPGMTRNDLTPLFTEDGGLDSRQQGRYVYAQCEYIKVDIVFSPVDGGANPSSEDKIVNVSRPYLDYPAYD